MRAETEGSYDAPRKVPTRDYRLPPVEDCTEDVQFLTLTWSTTEKWAKEKWTYRRQNEQYVTFLRGGVGEETGGDSERSVRLGMSFQFAPPK